jgi:glycosyltransferase involved in cell wall biosynthesis
MAFEILILDRGASRSARGLVQVLEDAALRAELSAAGLRRSAEFTWSKAAEKTLAILNRIGKGQH